MSYTNYNPMTMIKYLTSDDGKRFRVYDMAIEKEPYVIDTYKFECYPIDSYALPRATYPFEIKKVIYSNPATIVIWTDGTKTVVKCQEDDIYDEQTGLLMCIAKKAYGNTGEFNNVLREWEPKVEEECCGFNFDLTPVWDCIGDFIKTLDPSGGIMKNRKWIPCSERLPEKNGMYIVTVNWRDDRPTFVEFFNGKWAIGSDDAFIAWMPLPEPYKAE